MGLTPEKVINDPIHGHVELHPLLIKIIDTPQFQRLRFIKQLGGAYFVYPGASHNRFEHSIGVAHLAGELVRALKTRQPRLNITDRDVLCVEIAGLCHDLGHGPFSHLFDQMFIAKQHPGLKWKHEEASCKMIYHLVENIKLKPVMKQYGLEPDEDLVFIEEMIAGPINPARGEKQTEKHNKWPYKGRSEDKSFLYEIVANKRTGIDVDKFDYFARDCHHLGIQNNFDHRRFLQFARVCEVEEDGRLQKHICTRDKEEDNMYEMFHTRMCLHKRAYQHKMTNIIQTMIADAFLKADRHIQIEGSGGQTFTLSTAIEDMEAYTKLTDHVFEEILKHPSPELNEAKEILHRIITRNLYRFLREKQTKKPIEEINGKIEQWKIELAEVLPQRDVQLTPDDFEIQVITLDYGKKDKNPIDNLYFYRKHDTTKAFKTKASMFRPKRFTERSIRFYCKKIDGRSAEADRSSFDRWWHDAGYCDSSYY